MGDWLIVIFTLCLSLWLTCVCLYRACEVTTHGLIHLSRSDFFLRLSTLGVLLGFLFTVCFHSWQPKTNHVRTSSSVAYSFAIFLPPLTCFTQMNWLGYVPDFKVLIIFSSFWLQSPVERTFMNNFMYNYKKKLRKCSENCIFSSLLKASSKKMLVLASLVLTFSQVPFKMP